MLKNKDKNSTALLWSYGLCKKKNSKMLYGIQLTSSSNYWAPTMM